jgi:hypothetical protein
MTAVLNVYGTALNALSAGPSTSGYLSYPSLTAGEGAGAELTEIEDVLAVTTAWEGAIGNYGRFCRFPSRARIKSMEVLSDVALDTNATSTLKIDFGIAFSDNFSANGIFDGVPTQYAGLIPTTTANTTTTFASYSSPNKLFGQVVQGNNVKLQGATLQTLEITFNGTASNYSFWNILSEPAVALFGFTDGRGVTIEEMGYLDVYAYVAAVSATAQAGNILGRLCYSDE